jgi:hypothetical protein
MFLYHISHTSDFQANILMCLRPWPQTGPKAAFINTQELLSEISLHLAQLSCTLQNIAYDYKHYVLGHYP